jgi:hypothetical protein
VKTQVIQLNKNDDALSVRDKLSWSQTGRILLVWPAKGHVLNRQLDLNLVKHHAASIGVQLALVTHDSEVRYYAQQVNIPIFSNIQRAQDQPWGVSRPGKIGLFQKSQHHNLEDFRKKIHPPTPARMDHLFVRFVCLGFSVLALFTLGIFILPSANIILSPQIKVQSIRFDLSADPSSTSINISTGLLPTYIREAIVEGHDTITATGSVIFPDEPALANLKFTNKSKRVINIPTGTIVATAGSDPVRYMTISTSDVTIDPNKSIIVPARSIKPGSSGNLPPSKLVVIEGDLGRDLKVTNPDATQGGTNATVPAPTAQDLQILEARLRSQLKQVALTQIQSILPDEDTLISPTLSIIETIDEASIPSIGEPGNQLELTVRLRFKSQVVSGEVLRSLVIPIIDSNTPVGYSPIISTLQITQLSKPSLSQDGIAHWTVTATRKLQVEIQTSQAIDLVKGATVAKAKEYLSASLPLIGQAQIVLTPSWWPRLPFLTMRIQVTQAANP